MNTLQAIQSSLVAPKGQYNSFGKYHYRSCEDILCGVKPLLSQHNATLVISDEVVLVGDRYYVKATATLKAEDGEYSVTGYAREAATKKGQDDSQITGSTSSYARKYALNGLFAIDDTKDADATNDHGKSHAASKTTKSNDDTYDAAAKLLTANKAMLADMWIQNAKKWKATFSPEDMAKLTELKNKLKGEVGQ